MAGHVDILDQPEPLGRSLVGSVVLHVSVAAALLGAAYVGNVGTVKWGDPGGGGMGAVAVKTVATINLPSRNAPKNPVANPTESFAPEAPAKKKVQVKEKAPEPDAIPLKTRATRKRMMEQAASQPNTWREHQEDRPNQVYSTSGQALSSTMYSMSGSGGSVGIGSDSPLGSQYGAYAKLLRDRVANNWKTSDIDARISTAPPVAVTFTLVRNGSLAGSVKVTQSSGNSALDLSAQRAIYDSAPFPPLPMQYPQNQAVIELRFELRR